MIRKDTFLHVLTLLESGNTESAAAYLSEDFSYAGSLPMILNRAEFLEVFKGLVSGIPDLRFNPSRIAEKGDSLHMKIRMTGTHRYMINIPVLGLESVMSGGKSFVLPEEPVEIGFRDRLITDWHVTPVNGGGVTGILQQLGIEYPEPVIM